MSRSKKTAVETHRPGIGDRIVRTGLSVGTAAVMGGFQLWVEATQSASVIAEKSPHGINYEFQFIEGAVMAGIGVLSALYLLRKSRFTNSEEDRLFSLVFIPAFGVFTYGVCALLAGPIYHSLFGPADLMDLFR